MGLNNYFAKLLNVVVEYQGKEDANISKLARFNLSWNLNVRRLHFCICSNSMDLIVLFQNISD